MPSKGTLRIRSLNGVQVKVFEDQGDKKFGDKLLDVHLYEQWNLLRL